MWNYKSLLKTFTSILMKINIQANKYFQIHVYIIKRKNYATYEFIFNLEKISMI